MAHGQVNFEKGRNQRRRNQGRAGQVRLSAAEAAQVSPALVAACHKARLPLWTWTVDDTEQMEQLIRMGVDGIVTNVPQLLNATLARMNEHK